MPRRAAAAKARTAPPGRHGDGGGLYLLVRSPEARFWIFRYVRDGRMREMGLGPAAGRDAVSLAEARGKAADLRKQLRAHVDPLAQRKAEAAAAKATRQGGAAQGMTFRAVADLYLHAHDAGWRNAKHRAQWRNTLSDYAFPHFGDLPAAAVQTAHVMAALEPIWQGKPETASRLRGRIEAVLDYATARGWRTGENPARWRGHLANLLPSRAKVRKVEHHAALPWREMGGFMAALREREGMAALALEFTILTAARTGEAIAARWSEIDLHDAVWAVPAGRMKGGREHRVPLSGPALAVLRKLLPLRPAEGDAYVFPGTQAGLHLSSMAMTMALRRIGRGDLTVHGFRSTFRDWCADKTTYPNHVAEAALAHVVADKVEAAYRRGDLLDWRRRLMEEWATFCGQPAAAGEVVTLRRAIALPA